MGRNISETEIKKLKYLMSKIEPVKESEGFDAEFKRKLNE